MSADLRLVGRVARAHGNRGQVIVNLETDFAEERFKAGNVLLVGPEASATPREIVSARFHLGRPVIGLSGIETMNEAEGLAGAELWMPAAALEPLPLGTYYRHDLVGCEVRDAKGHAVGIVREVEGTLERSYLVVDGECGEVMIPMVAEICRTIDIPARRIDVVLPEGLVEINPTRISRGGGAKSGQRTAERDRP